MFLYQHKLFYPVTVQGPNPEYARILMEHYGGKDSEFSAASQYLNHRLNMQNPYLRELLGMIAAEEMGHMEAVAVAVTKLGGRLAYVDSKGVPWNISYVDQSLDPLHMLQADVEAEVRAKALYSRHYGMIADPGMRQLIAVLIQREDIHASLFSRAKQMLPAGTPADFEQLVNEYRQSMLALGHMV
ncbi:MAG: manganese catalase family protein [Firmicutes bacterium]|nr:manganese catalase family protein [Bacillota bacterium]